MATYINLYFWKATEVARIYFSALIMADSFFLFLVFFTLYSMDFVFEIRYFHHHECSKNSLSNEWLRNFKNAPLHKDTIIHSKHALALLFTLARIGFLSIKTMRTPRDNRITLDSVVGGGGVVVILWWRCYHHLVITSHQNQSVDPSPSFSLGYIELKWFRIECRFFFNPFNCM